MTMDKILQSVFKSLIPWMMNNINKTNNNECVFVKLQAKPKHSTEINLHVSEKPEPRSHDCTMHGPGFSESWKA